MAHSSIICGVDIGNSAVKTVISEIDRVLGRAQVIGVSSVPSNGMRRGIVADMEETTQDVGYSVRKAEEMAGVKLNRVYVSINGLHIRNQPSRGIIAVSRADGEISQNDINRVVDAAAAISLPANRELIHIIPKNFVIDGQEHIKNPLGMRGVRLEVDVTLIDGLSPHIQNLAKCLNNNGLEVAEFVFTPLATAKAILDKHQMEHGVLSIDFGGGVSTLALFHEGELVHTATLPVGSRHITNDLAIAFRTSMDKAEEIKCQHGFVGSGNVSSKGSADLSELLGEEEFSIPKKQIAKIIDARTGEFFDLVSSEMKKVSRGYLLPAGIVLAGGGVNLDGFPVLTKDRMKLAVKVGTCGTGYFTEGIRNRISDPGFAAAVGLVIWGSEKETSQKQSRGINVDVGKIGKWFKNFLP